MTDAELIARFVARLERGEPRGSHDRAAHAILAELGRDANARKAKQERLAAIDAAIAADKHAREEKLSRLAAAEPAHLAEIAAHKEMLEAAAAAEAVAEAAADAEERARERAARVQEITGQMAGLRVQHDKLASQLAALQIESLQQN
jgi:hypothetical protein